MSDKAGLTFTLLTLCLDTPCLGTLFKIAIFSRRMTRFSSNKSAARTMRMIPY